MPAAEFTTHFDRAYLATVPAPAAATLNASWADIQRLRLDSITTSAPDTLVFVVTTNSTNKLSVTVGVDAQGLISGLHLQPAGVAAPQPSSSAASAAAGGVPPGVRQIAVGVGSPPLKATLTLPAGKGPFSAIILVSGSGPSDQDETIGPDKPFRDIAARPGRPGCRYPALRQAHPRLPLGDRCGTATPTEEYVPDAARGGESAGSAHRG